MLKDLQVEYVILGHSERRGIFGETDEMIQKKVEAALKAGIRPILCVGETLEEREAGKQEEKVQGQLLSALQGLSPKDLESLVIAYEPIWAIGTGKSASEEDAKEMANFIRQQVSSMLSKAAGDAVRILYGGSVKPENIKAIMEQEDIDGALVGGASLEAASFISLVNYRID